MYVLEAIRECFHYTNRSNWGNTDELMHLKLNQGSDSKSSWAKACHVQVTYYQYKQISRVLTKQHKNETESQDSQPSKT